MGLNPQLSAAQKNSQLTEAGTPDPAVFRIARPLGGGLADAAAFVADTAVVVNTPIAGALLMRLRGKVSSDGTLSFAYLRPPPNQATAYDTDLSGPHADVAVIADTEFVVDITPGGESLLEVTWTPDDDGTVTFLDQMQQ